MPRWPALRRMASAVALALAAPLAAGSAEVRVDGLSLELPAGWTEVERGSWAGPGDGCGLQIAVRPGYTEISRGRIAEARRDILRAMASEGCGFRLEALRVIELEGLRALRLDATSRVGEVELRQVQYIVSGSDTYVLTFSAPLDRGAAIRAEADRSVASLRIAGEARLEQRMPAGLCGGSLAVLAALAGSLRATSFRARRRAGSRRRGG